MILSSINKVLFDKKMQKAAEKQRA